jgi:hypothetical protein
LKDGAERALTLTVQYEDPTAADGGSVEGLEIDQLTLNDREMQAYSQMQANGQLSLQTFWQILDRAGRLPENFDAQAEERLVQQESQAKNDNFLKQFARGQ